MYIISERTDSHSLHVQLEKHLHYAGAQFKRSGWDSIPFAQWSPEALGTGFILPFALTNSGRLPSSLPTGETLPSFATWARRSESHPLIQPKNENTPVWGCSIFGGAFHFVSEPRFIFVSSIFGCVFPRNRLPSRASV